jgi:hypothetical protein
MIERLTVVSWQGIDPKFRGGFRKITGSSTLHKDKLLIYHSVRSPNIWMKENGNPSLEWDFRPSIASSMIKFGARKQQEGSDHHPVLFLQGKPALRRKFWGTYCFYPINSSTTFRAASYLGSSPISGTSSAYLMVLLWSMTNTARADKPLKGPDRISVLYSLMKSL